MAFGYPVMLEVRGRRCVVVGGGAIGEDKVRGLVSAGAHVTVIDPEPAPGLFELCEANQVTLVRREYIPGDLKGAFLAVAATDDGAANAGIFREAEAEGVLLNAVDDVAHCHFAVPSIVRRGDLVVAIGTGGKAPALAKKLRRRLEAELGDEYATLVDLLGEVREEALPVREVSFGEWAARWETALRADLIDLVRRGRYQQVKDSVMRVLNGGKPAGHVWIVGAGPGDPELITVKGRLALEAADVVVYDRLVDPILVRGKETIYAGKAAGLHSLPQPEINATLIRLARQGLQVVRLKGGDPFVFGRGGEEAEALASAGIGFTVVPAPTSAIAAVAAAGIPVTDRRYSSSVTIATGHCCGPSTVNWRGLAAHVETLVILMGSTNLRIIAGELIAGGLSAETPAAMIQNGTMPSQRVLVADLETLAEEAQNAGFGSPSLVVVGEVVRLRERLTRPPVPKAALVT